MIEIKSKAGRGVAFVAQEVDMTPVHIIPLRPPEATDARVPELPVSPSRPEGAAS